jgi:hypothetical protein
MFESTLKFIICLVMSVVIKHKLIHRVMITGGKSFINTNL